MHGDSSRKTKKIFAYIAKVKLCSHLFKIDNNFTELNNMNVTHRREYVKEKKKILYFL